MAKVMDLPKQTFEKVADLPKRAVQYLTEVKLELKRVSWPSKREVYGTTVVVIITVFFFAFYLWIVDMIITFGVDRIFKLFVPR